jgi:uncharacterized protein
VHNLLKSWIFMAAAAFPLAAHAQPPAPISGLRLDVVGTGEVQRAPDQVTLSAGVVSRSPQAEAALRQNAVQMVRVRAALERAGIAARDIQTGYISLSQEYRPDPAAGGEPQPAGFVASNTTTVRFRDVARAGRIIDALVSAGANQVNGPSFGIADPEPALNEARAQAVAAARARAELYARALRTRVRRIVAVSEADRNGMIVGGAEARLQSMNAADTRIEPGELTLRAQVNVTFELDQPGG